MAEVEKLDVIEWIRTILRCVLLSQTATIDYLQGVSDYLTQTRHSHLWHERVRFIQADTHQFAQQAKLENLQFDAALAILVAHFVPVAEKPLFFQDIYQTLKPAAILLSYDLMQQTENIELRWMQNLALDCGLTTTQAEKMLARLADDFHLITADAQAALLTQVGFRQCKTYCQLMNYYGFFAEK